MGADSDEEEKRAVRARAANADQSSTAEGRNQSAAADVGSHCFTHITRCMLNMNSRCGECVLTNILPAEYRCVI